MPSRPRPGTSDEIRRAFVEFFAERGHVHQPSSSLVPFNDPSVLLTTAGMQQMIPYMLGREAPPAVRMTSVQKCFRTGDIDEVGNPRNLTFFEMLQGGPYPTFLKRRVLGQHGHLSNLATAKALATCRDKVPAQVWLAHLSPVNNRPGVALDTISGHLARVGLGHVTVQVAERTKPSLRWTAEPRTRQLALL